MPDIAPSLTRTWRLVTLFAFVALAILILPWTVGVDLKVGQPTIAMGQFFADNFQRRTGQPLRYVAGDPRRSCRLRVDVGWRLSPARRAWADAQ